MAELLKINDLTVGFEYPYGSITAVKNADLTVEEGEILALVGESGCGKTVLCKSMLGILCSRGKIENGSIEFMGNDLTGMSEGERVNYRGKDIGMVFQDPMTSLDPAFSVGDQIAEVLRIHDKVSADEARPEAVRLMELVKIPDAAARYDQRPYQFSGGMRQRVAIAIALAGRPRLLLADEPTTALDEQTRMEIVQLLREIVRETGTAMLFITHDLSLAEVIAGRVAVMKDGVIVEIGKTEKIFNEPEHEYTRKLLGYLDYSKNRGHNHRASGLSETLLAEVRDLSKTYDMNRHEKQNVFSDISFEVHRGEIIGIVGRSGCGKSTLSRCIMGLEEYDSGDVYIKENTEMQIIFQDTGSSFNERMSVRQIIEEPLKIRNHRIGRRGPQYMDKAAVSKAVTEAMGAVELDAALADRKTYELSGGQRQRVAVARALVTSPDIVIADEPLTGLDVTAQAQVVHLFRKLADERKLAVIFIAHDLPMVNHISSRVIEL